MGLILMWQKAVLPGQIIKTWPHYNPMDKANKTNWSGSQKTEQMVRDQIKERWGNEEAQRYDPLVNCMTVRKWNELGYRVKSGERAIKSFVVVEEKDDKGEVVKTFPKTINLFYDRQVVAAETVAA